MSGALPSITGGSGRIKRTEYTTGTGTHTYETSATWRRITICAGGGGGARSNNGDTTAAGGGTGVPVLVFEGPITSVSDSYVVGAAGLGATTSDTAGGDGGFTRLGTLMVPGGKGGSLTADVAAPAAGNYLSSVSAALADAPSGMFIPGGHGGKGNPSPTAGSKGGAPNFPAVLSGVGARNGAATPGASTGGYGGSGCGGDSALGKGGDGGPLGTVGGAGTGYGAGGGGGGPQATSANGGNGSGGYIRIEEYI